MLNISQNSIHQKDSIRKLHSFRMLAARTQSRRLLKTLYILGGLMLVVLFLPWTQNISSQAKVTALKPNQRPQTIQSVIAGRIEKWFVQEGQFVKRGDTILFLSETKAEYLDPNLVENSESQLKSKEFAVKSYMEKIEANDAQIDAMINSRALKLSQAKNKLIQAHLKVENDSSEFVAAAQNDKVAKDQLKRFEGMYREGLKSLTDLETRRLKIQETQAKLIQAENKYITSKNEVINAQIELQSIEAEYRDKISKAESEKYATLSSMYDAEASVTKLQNQVVSYSIRSGMYYVLAPQDGFITQAIQTGIGETIKEGSKIVSIMPADFQLAIEMFVAPMDIPLIQKDQKVQIQFDGWPAIFFSGWPGISYGTYTGKIVAIDNTLSDNGKYRVLVAPTKESNPWPKALRLGSGAKTISFLNEVPIYYELWRNINGFPPDYYIQKNKENDAKKSSETGK